MEGRNDSAHHRDHPWDPGVPLGVLDHRARDTVGAKLGACPSSSGSSWRSSGRGCSGCTWSGASGEPPARDRQGSPGPAGQAAEQPARHGSRRARPRRSLAGVERARDRSFHPAAPLRRTRLPAALARPDDLRPGRPGHPARVAAGRRPDPRCGREPDGDADRGRAAAPSAVLAAGRRLARSRPEPATADDRGRPHPGRGHREHPARLRDGRPGDATAVRGRVRGRVVVGRVRPVLEHGLRVGDAAGALRRGDVPAQRQPLARRRRRADDRRPAGPGPRGAAGDAGGRPLVPGIGRLPASHPIARAAHRA